MEIHRKIDVENRHLQSMNGAHAFVSRGELYDEVTCELAFAVLFPNHFITQLLEAASLSVSLICLVRTL